MTTTTTTQTAVPVRVSLPAMAMPLPMGPTTASPQTMAEHARMMADAHQRAMQNGQRQD